MVTRPLAIRPIGPDRYCEYAAISNDFLVTSILRVDAVDGGLGGMVLVEERIERPYLKEYGDDGPSAWAREFDLGAWGILLAEDESGAVGGAAVSAGARVYPLDYFQRDDLTVLWDIRVREDVRGRGIGTQLFASAAAWARDRGYRQLGIETQNVNVPACRFYARQGCRLGAIHRFGYAGRPDVAHEAMLLWYFDL